MYSEGKRKRTSRFLRLISCAALSGAVFILVAGCGASRKKLTSIQSGDVSAQLTLSKNVVNDVPEIQKQENKRDTILVKDLTGKEVLVMKAVKDESTGEMVASDVLDAAVVTARFRNIAERHGKVDIAFLVTVPASMQDSRWQLRLDPCMYILSDTLNLDKVIITGNDYRKAQLRGYQLYDRFVNRIITDTLYFVNKQQLEYFLQRNIPDIYALKDSNEEISEEQFESMYGIDQQEAVNHYTNWFARRRNDKRNSMKGAMFDKYVKAPIVTEGIRLDSVMVDSNGDFVYNYVQTIKVRPKLRKVQVVLGGAIFEQEKRLYTIPQSDPLTFYISSVSAFTDKTEHYKSRVISRRAEANTECSLDFELGKYNVQPEMNENAKEIHSIKKNLASLIVNEEFDLDSIVVAATASPEGGYAANKSLAQKRSESVCDYFNRYVIAYRDSLKREEAISINVDETYTVQKRKQQRIRFKPRCIPENWEDLVWYVDKDSRITADQKEVFNEAMSIRDFDSREARLNREDWYKYVKDELYPKLRTVKFNFYLHRKGMVKDTIHTTELDRTYMRGVQALQDMDYETAVTLLAPYKDFNTAIAYIGMDRNKSALQILEKLEPTAQVEYLLALLYSRIGNARAAVDHYMASCRMNSSYVHRGNLDPEISILIKQYGLNKLLEQDPLE